MTTPNWQYNSMYQPQHAPVSPWQLNPLAPQPVTPIQVTLTDHKAATDDAPRVLAWLRNASHGHDTLRRLAVGDVTALAEAGVATTGLYDPTLHEWGLGRRTTDGTYWLVSGGSGMVDWGHAALAGYSSVAHTHPYEPIDRVDVTAQLAPTLVAALTGWQTTFGNIPIVSMPGNLWYLFPSNQDLGAAYYTDHQETELLYPPYCLDANGWLHRSQGRTLAIEFGPVFATLRSDANVLAKKSKVSGFKLGDPASKLVEEQCLQYLWAPLTIWADATAICAGYFQVDPLKSKSGRSPEFAWFRQTMPNGVLRRTDVYQFLNSVK